MKRFQNVSYGFWIAVLCFFRYFSCFWLRTSPLLLQCFEALSDIIKCIADMKAADAAFVDSAFKEVLKRGNTIDLQLG